jgi:flagellar motility protein MotE (MotC chaperone)
MKGTMEGATMAVLKPHRWYVVAVALVAGLSLAACGSTASPSNTTSPAASAPATSPAPDTSTAVCQAAAELRDSVSSLLHITSRQGAVNEVKSDLANVEAKLNALTAQLHDSLKPQTNAVKSSLDSLKTAVSNLGAQPSTSAVTAVVTAAGGLSTAVRNLMAALPQCGTATASPS